MYHSSSASLLNNAGGFQYATKGLLLVGLAAALGALRYGGISKLANAHELYVTGDHATLRVLS
jgi:hypothetical protein